MARHQTSHGEGGAESERTSVSHDDRSRVNVEPEEADEDTSDKRADNCHVELAWCIEQRDHHIAQPCEDHRPAGKPIKTTVWGGIKDGMNELVSVSGIVPDVAKKLVTAKRADIVSGKFHVFAGPIKAQDGSIKVTVRVGGAA